MPSAGSRNRSKLYLYSITSSARARSIVAGKRLDSAVELARNCFSARHHHGTHSARQSGRVTFGGVPCASIAISTTSPAFDITSKRRKSFPSETRVKRGRRFVHGEVELSEKLGRNDLCPCVSARRFQGLLHGVWPPSWSEPRRLLSESNGGWPDARSRPFSLRRRDFQVNLPRASTGPEECNGAVALLPEDWNA